MYFYWLFEINKIIIIIIIIIITIIIIIIIIIIKMSADIVQFTSFAHSCL